MELLALVVTGCSLEVPLKFKTAPLPSCTRLGSRASRLCLPAPRKAMGQVQTCALEPGYLGLTPRLVTHVYVALGKLLICLCLSFPVCKMGVMMVPTF